MNPLDVFYARELGVFHLRMAGCNGCGEVIDATLRGRTRGACRIVECSSPRHADLIVVSGCWTPGLSEAALAVISQAPERRILIAAGDCATGSGTIAETFKTGRTVADYMEVDLETEGCPVRIEGFTEGVRRVTG